MPDYQKGKIYKITSGELIYIGSTCEPTLAKRLAKHVTDFKQWKEGKRGKVTSFQLIETGIYEITLIELCPCGSKDELTARERVHIENTVCVNKFIPCRTQKEWYEVNKEDLCEKSKAYNKINADKLKIKRDLNKEQKKAYNKARYQEKKDLKNKI